MEEVATLIRVALNLKSGEPSPWSLTLAYGDRTRTIGSKTGAAVDIAKEAALATARVIFDKELRLVTLADIQLAVQRGLPAIQISEGGRLLTVSFQGRQRNLYYMGADERLPALEAALAMVYMIFGEDVTPVIGDDKSKRRPLSALSEGR